MTPDLRYRWYRPSDLDADSILVAFWLPQGEAFGMKKFIRRGKSAVYRIRKSNRHFEDLPKWATPSLWRPIREDMWPYPLPEPVTILTPPERPEPVASPRKPQEAIDVTIHRYSEPGEISRAEAEIRMIRFIRTERVSPFYNPTGLRSGWPGYLDYLSEWSKSLEEARKDATRDPTPRWEPTPRDITDSETVVKWFTSLNPPGLSREPVRINDLQEVIIWRALEPMPSWAEIGDEMGVTDARDLYRRALNAVHRVANGEPAYPHLNLPDPIAELRRRNRLWRERAATG